MTRQGFWKLLGRYARAAGIRRAHLAPQAPPQLRHPPARGRRRPARGPGDARPRRRRRPPRSTPTSTAPRPAGSTPGTTRGPERGGARRCSLTGRPRRCYSTVLSSGGIDWVFRFGRHRSRRAASSHPGAAALAHRPRVRPRLERVAARATTRPRGWGGSRSTRSPTSTSLGTILLPLLGVPFGWAKPVPVNPARFRRGVHMGTGHDDHRRSPGRSRTSLLARRRRRRPSGLLSRSRPGVAGDGRRRRPRASSSSA